MQSWAQRGSSASVRLARVLGRRDADAGRLGGDSTGSWTPSAVRGVAVLLAAAIAVGAWWWWTGRPRDLIPAPTVLTSGVALPDVQAPSAPASARGTVVVHVIGKVVHPGLVRLPAGSRVADAVEAAGGVTDPQANATVNLARLLMDGEQVAVGVPAPGSAESGALSLSSATAEQLDSLPGIGPVLAARIITWRTSHGPFRSVDQLGDVPGIGPSLLSQLRGAVQP